jgi:DNA-binding NarL/FixJ family response regulator
MIRVAVVEDQDEVREGLALLVRTSPGFTCVGAFGDAEGVLDQLPRLHPDVLLMDIGLPGMDGIEATRRIRDAHPDVQVMMLTVYEDEARIFRSLRAGATGYVLKTTPPRQLLDSITTLHRGGSPMSSSIARRVVEEFQRPAPSEESTAALTPREREILELVVRGYRYREIGKELFISLDTVRTHIRHIYEKMHVRSRGEAVARYTGLDEGMDPRSPHKRPDTGEGS